MKKGLKSYVGICTYLYSFKFYLMQTLSSIHKLYILMLFIKFLQQHSQIKIPLTLGYIQERWRKREWGIEKGENEKGNLPFASCITKKFSFPNAAAGHYFFCCRPLPRFRSPCGMSGHCHECLTLRARNTPPLPSSAVCFLSRRDG